MTPLAFFWSFDQQAIFILNSSGVHRGTVSTQTIAPLDARELDSDRFRIVNEDALHSEISRHLAGKGTRLVRIERDLLPRVGSALRPLLPSGLWLLVADRTTWPLAGPQIEAPLKQLDQPCQRFIVELRDGAAKPTAGLREVEALQAHIRESSSQVAAVVAIGSGTLSDITKLAAHRAGLRCAVVATAPSMNGYTSGIAAMMIAGVKQSVPCRPPVACLADLDLMSQAPYEMIAAGFGDLVSRSVSTADWYLSHVLTDSAHDPSLLKAVDASGKLIQGIAGRLPARDSEAIARLTAALCISGLVMQSSSAPVSGGEHLISHYLDMTAPAHAAIADLHGRQVGVATLATSALYELLRISGPAEISSGSPASWTQLEESLRQHFGELSGAVLETARQVYGTTAERAERLARLRSEWDSIWHVLGARLRGLEEIRGELLAARAPVRFSAIGVSLGRARDALVFSQHIRARYTILHLCGELGLLADRADELVERLEGSPETG